MFTSDERFQKQPCSVTANGQRRCQVDRDEVINFISSHVRAINQIYIGSSFKWREGSRKVRGFKPDSIPKNHFLIFSVN